MKSLYFIVLKPFYHELIKLNKDTERYFLPILTFPFIINTYVIKKKFEVKIAY